MVIAAITSCTNTSNPNVLVAAGLVAEKAVKLGMRAKPWVKTSLAPGSLVVADYLKEAGLQKSLDKLGFTIAGYGCTTCIGNSGPLDKPISDAIEAKDLVAAAVLSGNRNFEGRITSAREGELPRLAAAGRRLRAFRLRAEGSVQRSRRRGQEGQSGLPERCLADQQGRRRRRGRAVKSSQYKARAKTVFDGTAEWRKIKPAKSLTYAWDGKSTYVQNPPYFAGMGKEPPARSPISSTPVRWPSWATPSPPTTFRPPGAIKKESPAGSYLTRNKVRKRTSTPTALAAATTKS